ncbi:phenazine biosynthesis-like domain-containing protein 1 [Ptychodera flava]|uniref:phenazine biosynthesis-like domain-containing protein 1 n=1 Tax=Ptychodera flava TaxID=63121 RepID=UPI00396A1F75
MATSIAEAKTGSSNPEVEGLLLFTVDAFTKRPFSGNPAAVCPLEQSLDDDVRHKIAAEMNLSETAFIERREEGTTFQTGKSFGLRWFTPVSEVILCGHATLASAFVLFSHFGNQNELLSFETLSGTLYTRKNGDAVTMDLPLYATVHQNEQQVTNVVQAAIGSLPIQDIRHNTDMKKLLVRLQDSVTSVSEFYIQLGQLETMKVDIGAMMAADDGSHVKGVMVTLRGSRQNHSIDSDGNAYDFVSRYFAPWVAIPEDPVTGSAHAVLAGYWSTELNKKSLYARQCSPRGGDLHISLRDDGRVDITGHAVIVMQAKFSL